MRARPAFLATLMLLSLGTRAAHADSVTQFTYATMNDGVQIALAVSYPPGLDPGAPARTYPALFMMDGYEGGAGPVDPAEYGDRYVIVHASVRGTGCSGGRFDLFDRRTADDGHDIIESWIVRQPWSDQDVGIIGHSYPGLTGFMVATTDPPHLKAIAVSGLIDDLYRGITYMGGIPDPGFPLLWTGVARPLQEQTGNAGRYYDETSAQDPTCAANIASRPAPNAADDPVLNGTIGREDGVWWSAHSLITYIQGITKPIWIAQQYQDEQTGPRGGVVLWQNIPAGVPKRLVMTNGVHATNDLPEIHADRVAWLDCWMLHDCRGDIADPSARVQIHFETTGIGNDPQLDKTNPAFVSSDYPLPDTRWARTYLRSDGTLTARAPGTSDPARTYLATPAGRQAYLTGAGVADSTSSSFETALDNGYTNDYGPVTSADGPDQLGYSLPFANTTVLAGPMEASLWLSSTAPDTDVFVQLIDEDSQGNRSYLQRGMLRASFRAMDPSRSDRTPAGDIYRPYHPFTSPVDLTPGGPVKLDIEIFPLQHVFRAGHRLLVQIYSPPVMDEFYSYASAQAPAVNTILDDAAHPSSILLPFMPELPPISVAAPGCGHLTGVRCTKPD